MPNKKNRVVFGFAGAQVYPLGGAWTRFEADGTITIYGSSQEFGVFDKEYAANPVQKVFPAKTA